MLFRRRGNPSAELSAIESLQVKVADRLREVRSQIEANEGPDVIVDLQNVEKINSWEVGEMIRMHLRLRDHDRRLIVANATGAVAEVIQITRLNRTIEVRNLEAV